MTSVDSPPLGNLLRQWRRAASLTQEDLAERAGMSVETISALERGISRSPYRATIISLADALALDREDRARFLAAGRPEYGSPIPVAAGARPESAPAHPSTPLPAIGSLAHAVMGLQEGPLLGRTKDLDVVRQVVLGGTARLITLVGPAGVGKTSLALEVGRAVISHFAEGTIFVDLTTVRDPDKVLMVVGQSLGFKDLESSILHERLQSYLAERELLLLLDNVEHVLAPVQELAELLLAAPRLTLLATSREPLHLRSEQVFHVAPLALPDLDTLLPLEEVAQIPSVALFLRRAQAINPDFALDENNAQAVAELVVRLDGLPLAIELAAARTSLLSPQMILERLGQRLSLLRWQAHDLPERQQTLRSAVAWSYELLSPEEQAFFRHLGIFAASFSFHSAEAMAEPLAIDGLEGLASLVDKSLVQVQSRDREDVRYVLLESMRDFARERLVEAGELEEAERRRAISYVDRAEQAELELTGPKQGVWFKRIEWGLGDVRAALRWLLDHDEGERALRLATALGYFWEVRGYTAEGRRWLEETLARAPEADPGLRARGLSWLGFLLIWSADEPDYPKAILSEALELARSVQDRETIARSLMHLGVLDHLIEKWDQSRRELDEAMTYWRDLGNTWGIASTLLYYGGIELRQEHYQEATRLLEGSLARLHAMNDESALLWVLFSLAYTAGEQGNLSEALTYLQELLRLSTETQNRRHLYLCGLGVLYRLRDQGGTLWVPEQLARLVGAMHQLREMMGIGWGKIVSAAIPFLPIASEALCTRLGHEAFEAALAQGRAFSFPQTAALIGNVLDEVAQGDAAKKLNDEKVSTLLSPREQDLLQLVAEGLTNKEIARRLILSEYTIKSHVTSLFNKLGVDSRAHAVAVAAQRDLL
jgi:predicted ATPase/DNA-binding CsgD family transcriptional regulator/transcriptional regulator with XRE-family HTH domain